MSLDPPTYLSSLQNNIRARPIPWEGAVRAGTITDSDLKTIKAVDKVRKEQRKQTVENDIESYQSLILGGDKGKSVLESASKRADVIQYMLVLTGDLINDVPSLASKFLEHPEPYKPIVPYLSQSTNPEDPIPLLASSVLTCILSTAQTESPKSNPKTDEALTKLYKYLSTLTTSHASSLQDIAVQEYSSLLRSKKAREIFWSQREETVSPLFDILRAAAGASKDSDSTLFNGGSTIRSATEAGLGGGVGLQLLYHVLLTIWQLSFEASLVGKGLEKEQELIPLYTQLLRLSPKEKTTRILLSTLFNLFSAPTNKSTLLPVATTARLPALLSNLKGRHLTDPDLLDDLKALTDMLNEYTSSQTTFDEYAAELSTGKLRWSPPHRDADFWHENARKILDNDGGALPKALAEIMGKSWDDEKQVLAIACNDVGWLVKEAPEKRQGLEKLGIKGRVMELMTDKDETVRWESLRAVGEWMRYSFDD
ncbi:H(+)-transporting V1 sector ATPase subunit H [Imshaugia aleurites]|uniref:V-type proton ATPase subunit H n=1 Tax=Imshaugia aleurites TaxID=172621 RepID=A0A8H3ET43_9LECA|nr:H(+)-transporting V1 sector ATPase subunit H [Imshaugia aleurites]